jgi:2'-5' RNA ligase
LLPAGIPAEKNKYQPHLTLARSGSAVPHRISDDRSSTDFDLLQRKLSSMPVPDFGTMAAHEFCLYESTLSPLGSRYTQLASFSLR